MVDQKKKGPSNARREGQQTGDKGRGGIEEVKTAIARDSIEAFESYSGRENLIPTGTL